MKPVCAEEKKAPSNNSIAGYTNIYQKHRAVQTRKMTYTAWHLPGAGRLRGDVTLMWKHWIEAPVNGGRNYNGPKVAKFLVG